MNKGFTLFPNRLNPYSPKGVDMKKIGILLHGAVLSLINLVSILTAYALYKMIQPPNQIIFQVPVAMALTLVGYMLWYLMIRNRYPQLMYLCRSWELALVYGGSLVIGALLFIPLHYLTQGYLTAFTNILALWAFQAPVNLLTLRFAGCTLKLKNGDANTSS